MPQQAGERELLVRGEEIFQVPLTPQKDFLHQSRTNFSYCVLSFVVFHIYFSWKQSHNILNYRSRNLSSIFSKSILLVIIISFFLVSLMSRRLGKFSGSSGIFVERTTGIKYKQEYEYFLFLFVFYIKNIYKKLIFLLTNII